MKVTRYIIILLTLGATLTACKKDFLNVKTVDADIPVDQLYSNYNYVQGVVWNVYSYLPDGLGNIDMEAATDNAEATNVSSRAQMFNTGIWNQYNNPYGVWTLNFDGIRQANLYLKNKDKADIDYIKNKITTTDSTTYFNARDNLKLMEGEVLFLKAYFYFELVKRYGGVPIFEEPLDYKDKATWENIPRNSVNECLQYISTLCDKAATIIPADLSQYAAYRADAGRVTNGAILALKSRALLYGASPLFKELGSSVTWAQAAEAAYDVIALNAYSLDASYDNLYGANNSSSSEFIFYKRYGAMNALEYFSFPIAFEGSTGNSITPTQNFVDDFEVLQKDGSGNITGSVPFDWNNSTHTANPYANRDPRFATTVIYNDKTFKSTQIQTYTGGNSGLPKQNATKTGYYMAKWINPSVDLLNGTTTNHTWSYFRYGEILLNYAEAMFNAYGAEGDPEAYGMTALQAINRVRQRVNMPAITAGQLNQTRIEHERNVEMGFENQRFWDVRRWKKGTVYFKAPVNRIEITKTGTNFSYMVKKLEDRSFEEKMNLYPIPQSEIDKTNWTQNTNW
ncbi:RagB/SusD family nutrient uptake outer membrane protein [Pedobacter alpinus]|uniref:RagB/SusD family nutrient uptake outer membrane protein n=1 Tax=Pedobacter alpinus TaxID=1590643 RepID=A0ABW5TUP4_9SPHI